MMMVGFPSIAFMKDGTPHPRQYLHHILLNDRGNNVVLPWCPAIMIGKS